MTEEEAKKQPCIGPAPCGIEGNPWYDGGPPTRWCAGSACGMAWRVEMRSETIRGDTPGDVHIAHHVTGYCGLAGKP